MRARALLVAFAVLAAACEPPVDSPKPDRGYPVPESVVPGSVDSSSPVPDAAGSSDARSNWTTAGRHLVMPVIVQGVSERARVGPLAAGVVAPNGRQSTSPTNDRGSTVAPSDGRTTIAPSPPVAATATPQVDLATCSGIVNEDDGELVLNGEPVFLFGINVPYLLDNEFPEEVANQVVADVAQLGVNAIRVWYFDNESVERFERLLDLGRRHGLRFVVVLEDNVFKGKDWFFSEEDEQGYRVHLAKTVEQFRDRPEIAAWELINEPNCGDGGYGEDCVKTIRDWLVMASRIVREFDRCRPVSTGLIGAGNFPIEHESYAAIHGKSEIDLASVHRRIDEEWSDEAELSADDAILFGEIYDRAYDENCLPLSGSAASERAERVIDDLRDAIEAGVDGYLLWDYAAGAVPRTNGDVKYYCGPFGYEADDPVWAKVRQAELPPPVPWSVEE